MEKYEDQLDWDAMRELSKALFGSRERLPVAIAVLELGPNRAYPQAIKDRLGLKSTTRAEEELQRLIDAKLLKKPTRRRQPGRQGPKTKVYARCNDEFWDCLASLTKRRFLKRKPGF
jgi:hypothetical protein